MCTPHGDAKYGTAACLHWLSCLQDWLVKGGQEVLRSYGLESFHGDRLTIKKKKYYQSAVKRQNVYVSSMSGQCNLDLIVSSRMRWNKLVIIISAHGIVWLGSFSTSI